MLQCLLPWRFLQPSDLAKVLEHPRLLHTPQRMLPTQPRKAVEIGVGGNECASVFDGERGVLGVSHELARRPGGFAQLPKDGHVLAPGCERTRCRPGAELIDEPEYLVEAGGAPKDARVGGDSDDAGKRQHRQGERLRPGCQLREPNIYAQVAGHEAIVAMVGLGLGVGVAPELVVEASGMTDKIRYVSTAVDLPPLTIGLCASKQRLESPLVKSLWDVAGKTYKVTPDTISPTSAG